eukprot:scpid39362/ scgid20891/ 
MSVFESSRGSAMSTTMLLVASVVAWAMVTDHCSAQAAPKFAKDRLSKPPAPGVHPRVLFSPEDVPDILHRLQTTKVGKWAWQAITEGVAMRTNKSLTNAGPLPMLYAEMLAGNDTDAMVAAINGSGYCGPSSFCLTSLGSTLLYDSFISLVTADTGRAKTLGTGLVALANIAQKFLERTDCGGRPCVEEMNFQSIYMLIANDCIGMSYDFLANAMDESEKAVVRKLIATATAKHFIVGNGKPCYAVTSNWVSMHQFMTTMLLSIEGEEGYDAAVLARNTVTMTNFLECGVHASGATHEGMGKNYLHVERFAAFDRRGSELLQHPHFVNHVRSFYLNMMQPFGYAFTMVDNWGGSDNLARVYDLAPAKYFYPDDPVVDFVWRNAWNNATAVAQFSDLGYPHTGNSQFTHVPMSVAIYAQDWSGPEDFDTAAQALDANLTFFCDDRGLMVARDQWSQNATWFAFQWRSDQRWAGGHYHPDRGTFMLSAWGRTWAQYPPGDDGSDAFPFTVGNYQQSRKHSVLLVDGRASVPVNYRGSDWGTPAGKGEEFADTSLATFAATNLTYSYTWMWTRYTSHLDLENDTFVTPNDFVITPRTDDWMKMNVHDLVDPITPNFAPPNLAQNCSRAQYNPMEYVFRTAGLVRGKFPYAMVLDDAKKDDGVHLWEWLMQTPDDVELVEFNATDAILMDAGSPPGGGSRGLLIRVLDYSPPDDYSSVTALRHENYNLRTIGASHGYLHPARLFNTVGGLGRRIVVSTRAVVPSFKVMLFPFTDDIPLPITNYDKQKNTVDVVLPGQHDLVTFGNNPDGRTTVKIQRLSDEGNVVDEMKLD